MAVPLKGEIHLKIKWDQPTDTMTTSLGGSRDSNSKYKPYVIEIFYMVGFFKLGHV